MRLGPDHLIWEERKGLERWRGQTSSEGVSNKSRAKETERNLDIIDEQNNARYGEVQRGGVLI